MNIKQEARDLWRLWSVKLAAIAGLAVSYFAYDPSVVPRLVAMVPEEWRPVVSIAVGFFTFATATTARRLPQKPKGDA